MELKRTILDITANIVLLHVYGNITSDHLAPLEEEMSRLAEGKDPVRLILDFADVRGIDSTGVGALIKGRNEIVASGGKVAIVGSDRKVLGVLKISGLESYFLIAPSEFKAIRLLEEE
jgi:anti-anti-sigma factor